ncbi:RHS repeat-associated core domain-containing protein, partial [Desulfosporosinus sp. PR]|uniref:RHS repeat-associated core domain-containing protein n=1 Tax=Candidatus Desulfosporosinus nitrosoreducens TaxID=3401928 RepID=UPI0027FD62BB
GTSASGQSTDNSSLTLNVYDGFNQLIGTTVGDKTIAYSYDGDGLRAIKTVNKVTTNHIWDGQNIALETTGGVVTGTYLRGTNLIAGDFGGSRKYYEYNGHGDVVQLANTSGNVTKNYDYDAFGNEKNIDPNDTNVFRYSGEYSNLETNTYYLRARNYDPTTGRFLNEDTNTGKTIDPLSLNLYTYCFNNPILYVDMSGNWPELSDVTRTAAKWLIANPVNVYATQQGWFSDLFYKAGFVRDSGGVYHTRQDCWQQYFGYNDFYDYVFNNGTSMDKAKM